MLLSAHSLASSFRKSFPRALRIRPASTMNSKEIGSDDYKTYHKKWEGKWEKDGKVLQPGEEFDMTRAQPYLVKNLEDGSIDVKGKRILVPGCGRGYDVVAFAKHGAKEVVGLEIVPTAQQVASGYVSEQIPELVANGTARVDLGDFFEYDGKEGFDIAYDYTFFCALRPDMRFNWAKKYAELIKPGGHLITLLFPLDCDNPAKNRTLLNGTPFRVHLEHYRMVLEIVGFKLVRHEAVPPEHSVPMRQGREALGVWVKDPEFKGIQW